MTVMLGGAGGWPRLKSLTHFIDFILKKKEKIITIRVRVTHAPAPCEAALPEQDSERDRCIFTQKPVWTK